LTVKKRGIGELLEKKMHRYLQYDSFMGYGRYWRTVGDAPMEGFTVTGVTVTECYLKAVPSFYLKTSFNAIFRDGRL
jgi:hypothetical protein